MIVETSPTNPPSPARRALRLAGLAIPVVLFAAVLALGLLGPKPGPDAVARTVASSQTPSGAPAPSGTPNADGAAPGVATRPSAPATVANLRVRTVSAVLEIWRADRGPWIVAVAGYLRGGDAATCGSSPRLPGAGCSRQVVIAATPGGSPDGTGPGGIGSHVHAAVPPGVLLPGDPGGPASDRGATAPFVVLIGRFGAADTGCAGDLRGCEDPFTVERVAWSDGQPMPLTPRAEVGLLPSPGDPFVARTREAASAALGSTTAILTVLLVRPATLAVLDASAAEAVAAARRPADAGPVWYLRGLDVPYDPLPDPPYGLLPPAVRWAVVDQRTGAVIARGRVGVLSAGTRGAADAIGTGAAAPGAPVTD